MAYIGVQWPPLICARADMPYGDCSWHTLRVYGHCSWRNCSLSAASIREKHEINSDCSEQNPESLLTIAALSVTLFGRHGSTWFQSAQSATCWQKWSWPALIFKSANTADWGTPGAHKYTTWQQACHKHRPWLDDATCRSNVVWPPRPWTQGVCEGYVRVHSLCTLSGCTAVAVLRTAGQVQLPADRILRLISEMGFRNLF